MRKANKIMMITVSVLLCVVMFTSTALSGTLAKYVSSDSMSESARVAAWGVTVEVTPGADLQAKLDITQFENAASVTATFPDFRLKPGESIPKAIHIEIGGTPEVACRVKLLTHLNFSTSYTTGFGVNEGIAGASKDSYMPIGITFSAPDINGISKTSRLSTPWTTVAHYNAERYMQTRLCALIDAEFDSQTISYDASGTANDRHGYVYKDFAPGQTVAFNPVEGTYVLSGKTDVSSVTVTNKNENIKINEFDFGFEWPMNWPESGTSSIDYDQLTMYLTNGRDPYLTVTFTIMIEQIQ